MTMEIIIASAPDREKLVVEIWDDNKMIAEINQEAERLELEVYAEGNSVQVDYDFFLKALVEARVRLVGKEWEFSVND